MVWVRVGGAGDCVMSVVVLTKVDIPSLCLCGLGPEILSDAEKRSAANMQLAAVYPLRPPAARP